MPSRWGEPHRGDHGRQHEHSPRAGRGATWSVAVRGRASPGDRHPARPDPLRPARAPSLRGLWEAVPAHQRLAAAQRGWRHRLPALRGRGCRVGWCARLRGVLEARGGAARAGSAVPGRDTPSRRRGARSSRAGTSSSGITESREIRTSGLVAKPGSALSSASVTGRSSRRSAWKSTQTRLPAGSVGSGYGARTTRATPTAARSLIEW